MSRAREVRCYDYVNQPFERVRDVMKSEALAVFHAATKAASSRAGTVASELRVDIGGVAVGTDIEISLGEITEKAGDVTSPPTLRLPLSWKAVKKSGLFPVMQAELAVYPLTGSETQLDFSGRYDPPLGAVGDAIDAVVGHRIAEASVHRFVRDVATYLRRRLGGES